MFLAIIIFICSKLIFSHTWSRISRLLQLLQPPNILFSSIIWRFLQIYHSQPDYRTFNHLKHGEEMIVLILLLIINIIFQRGSSALSISVSHILTRSFYFYMILSRIFHVYCNNCLLLLKEKFTLKCFVHTLSIIIIIIVLISCRRASVCCSLSSRTKR